MICNTPTYSSSVKQSKKEIISSPRAHIKWSWAKTESFWVKKKNTGRWVVIMLFKIVPQEAIEALQSQHRSQWQIIGIQISEKKKKESRLLIETRLIFNFNCTSLFMHIDGCDNIQSHAGFGRTNMMAPDGLMRRKFHLTAVYIMSQMQIISYFNIFQS